MSFLCYQVLVYPSSAYPYRDVLCRSLLDKTRGPIFNRVLFIYNPLVAKIFSVKFGIFRAGFITDSLPPTPFRGARADSLDPSPLQPVKIMFRQFSPSLRKVFFLTKLVNLVFIIIAGSAHISQAPYERKPYRVSIPSMISTLNF